MKPKTFIIIPVLVMVIFFSGESFGQKWGKVSKEELNMTSIPEDLDADGVILFDKGEYFFGYTYPVTLREHKRIKVFTKKGTESADISIPFLHGEKIRDIEGHTFTREGRKIRLRSGQVFTKKGRDWDEVVFTMPGVEEGCVFEYRYDKWSDLTYVLGPWYFQNEFFTKLSQVSLRLPGGWGYSYRLANPGQTVIEPRVEDVLTPRSREKEYIWTLENVPPIREEPFVACIHDYRTSIYFELMLYKDRRILGYGEDEVIDTWGEFGEGVDTLYRSLTHGREKVNEKARDLTQGMETQPEKAVRIYDYVRQDISWNGERGIFNLRDKYLETLLTRLEGTAAEKNLLLWNLLRAAGIEAYPVLISTRDYGRMIVGLPGLFQFNHLIVCVRPLFQPGREEWFVDAIDRSCPFGMLPAGDLVAHGLLLDGKESRIIEIPQCKVSSRQHFVTKAQLFEHGGFACSTAVGYYGYLRIHARGQVSKQGRDEFAKQEALGVIPVAAIDTIAYTALDSVDQPLQMSFTLSAPQYAQLMGEKLYVNPTLFTRRETNPFKNESRSFAVEFGYPFSKIEETEFLIPSGFAVQELPANVNREIGGAKFSRTFSAEANLIRCRREMIITRPVFLAQYYTELRNFYQEIVSADQLLVVLGKELE
jgi:transglutaminase-like putative cysteine protease